MSLFGNDGKSNTAPKFHPLAGSNATGTALYGNTTVGAFAPNKAVGVFSADAAQVKANPKIQGSGWVMASHGVGPLTGAVVVAGGTGYANTDTGSVSGGTGANGSFKLTTNSTGGVVGVANVVSPGNFSAPKAVLTITTANGAGANLSLTFGGRANRVQYETLVAQGSNAANTGNPVPLA